MNPFMTSVSKNGTPPLMADQNNLGINGLMTLAVNCIVQNKIILCCYRVAQGEIERVQVQVGVWSSSITAESVLLWVAD